MPEPFHDLYVNTQKCQESKKMPTEVFQAELGGSRNKAGRCLHSTYHGQDSFHTDCRLTPQQPWEVDRTSFASTLRAEKSSETMSLEHTKEGVMSKSLQSPCPSCQALPRQLHGSFQTPMDVNAAALCSSGETHRGQEGGHWEPQIWIEDGGISDSTWWALDLFRVKCALCRIRSHVNDTRLG